MINTFYMVRHKHNGTWLPGGLGKGGRGGTHQEATNDRPPRLFSKRQHANAALRWWLEGICIVRYTGISTGWNEEIEQEWLTKVPPTPRIDEDWEVVEIQILPTVNSSAVIPISN